MHVYTRNDLVNMLIDDENSYEYVFNFYYSCNNNYNYYEFGFNRFDLILLDKSYNQVFIKEGLSKTSYTLKRSDWKQITILNYGYIYLKAYDKHGGVSGPYATSYYRFTIIDNLKPIIISDFKVGTSVIPNN